MRIRPAGGLYLVRLRVVRSGKLASYELYSNKVELRSLCCAQGLFQSFCQFFPNEAVIANDNSERMLSEERLSFRQERHSGTVLEIMNVVTLWAIIL